MIFIFDCDGVLIDSNDLKTKAFELVASSFFEKHVSMDLISYHMKNRGKSRWDKFNYIISKYQIKIPLNVLVDAFSMFLEDKLYSCDVVPGAIEFVNKKVDTGHKAFVASAGEQEQVQKLLKLKGCKLDYDQIYGSPESKLNIVKMLKAKFNQTNFVFFGDSVHDAECSLSIGARFVFVSGYTDTSSSEICSILGDKFINVEDFNSPDLKCFSN